MTLNHYFTGRKSELQNLRVALSRDGKAGVTQVISGLGGIGKSALALAYANRHQNDYGAIFFLNASSVAGLYTSFADINTQFDPPLTASTEPEVIVQTVRRRLATEPDWLLLVDNADFFPQYPAETLQKFLPQNHGGHVLITSRATGSLDALEVADENTIKLEDMEPEDAARFLWERVKGETSQPTASEKATLAALAEALFHFPLALEQAAAYIRKQHTTFGRYLTVYQDAPVPVPPDTKARVANTTKEDDYRRAVGTTWQFNLDALQNAGHVAAVDLFTLSAFLAPDTIPLQEIAAAAAPEIKSIGAFLGDLSACPLTRYDELLAPLLDYSLVTKDAASDTFSIHRLVQAVTRSLLTTKAVTNWKTHALTVLNNAFPSVEYSTWSRCGRLTAHAQAVAEHLTTARQKDTSLVRASLINQVAHYLTEQNRLSEAEPLFLEALAVRRHSLPDKHPDIANSLNNLAYLYGQQTRLSEAELLYLEALAIRRHSLPDKHPDIANTLNNLAGFYTSQNRLSEAEPLMAEALAILQQGSGAGHPNTRLVAENLQRLREAMKRRGASSQSNHSTAFSHPMGVLRQSKPTQRKRGKR